MCNRRKYYCFSLFFLISYLSSNFANKNWKKHRFGASNSLNTYLKAIGSSNMKKMFKLQNVFYDFTVLNLLGK